MTTKTSTQIFCDGKDCKKEIKDRTPAGSGRVQGKDYCPDCLKSLFEEVEKEYRRVIKGEVKGRRGWRSLGDHADT